MFLPPTALPSEHTGDQILKKQMYLLKQKKSIHMAHRPSLEKQTNQKQQQPVYSILI